MNLTDMTLEDLQEVLSGFPKFRAKQVFEWINRGCNVQEMNNVPGEIREHLAQLPFGGVDILNIDDEFKTVVKYLCRLDDGNVVECVLMNYKHGNSLCISSQVGCNMGCTFCASAIGGAVRNMTAGEMFFTTALLSRKFGDKEKRGVTNIVVMGSGEPLINFDATVEYVEQCRDRLGISPRNITISTCGIPDKMRELADLQLGCNLALSLHAPNDIIRKQLMPIAEKYTLGETMAAMDYHFFKTGRRSLIEYMLIKGVNDSPENCKQLAGVLHGKNCHVNIIPFNSVKEVKFIAPNKVAVEEFHQHLNELGISSTVRRELGDNIDAACGQLRRKFIENGSNK